MSGHHPLDHANPLEAIPTTEGLWWMRLLDWLEDRAGGDWPWGEVWLWHGFSFHFASGYDGFGVGVPLPRWLPGFVKPYQVGELRTRAGRRDSDLTMLVPLFPPRRPSTMRTRRLRARA